MLSHPEMITNAANPTESLEGRLNSMDEQRASAVTRTLLAIDKVKEQVDELRMFLRELQTKSCQKTQPIRQNLTPLVLATSTESEEAISTELRWQYQSISTLSKVTVGKPQDDTKPEITFCDLKGFEHSDPLAVCKNDSVDFSSTFVTKMTFIGSWSPSQPFKIVSRCLKPPPKPPDVIRLDETLELKLSFCASYMFLNSCSPSVCECASMVWPSHSSIKMDSVGSFNYKSHPKVETTFAKPPAKPPDDFSMCAPLDVKVWIEIVTSYTNVHPKFCDMIFECLSFNMSEFVPKNGGDGSGLDDKYEPFCPNMLLCNRYEKEFAAKRIFLMILTMLKVIAKPPDVFLSILLVLGTRLLFKPMDIGFLLVTCSLFHTTPFLSHSALNKYEMSRHTKCTNHSGVVFSAVIKVLELVKDIVKVHMTNYGGVAQADTMQNSCGHTLVLMGAYGISNASSYAKQTPRVFCGMIYYLAEKGHSTSDLFLSWDESNHSKHKTSAITNRFQKIGYNTLAEGKVRRGAPTVHIAAPVIYWDYDYYALDILVLIAKAIKDAANALSASQHSTAHVKYLATAISFGSFHAISHGFSRLQTHVVFNELYKMLGSGKPSNTLGNLVVGDAWLQKLNYKSNHLFDYYGNGNMHGLSSMVLLMGKSSELMSHGVFNANVISTLIGVVSKFSTYWLFQKACVCKLKIVAVLYNFSELKDEAMVIIKGRVDDRFLLSLTRIHCESLWYGCRPAMEEYHIFSNGFGLFEEYKTLFMPLDEADKFFHNQADVLCTSPTGQQPTQGAVYEYYSQLNPSRQLQTQVCSISTSDFSIGKVKDSVDESNIQQTEFITTELCVSVKSDLVSGNTAKEVIVIEDTIEDLDALNMDISNDLISDSTRTLSVSEFVDMNTNTSGETIKKYSGNCPFEFDSSNDVMVQGCYTVLKAFTENVDMMLNLRVTKIDYGSDKVMATIEEGRSFVANTLIITASLGVLKAYLIKFEPNLLEWKIAAISGGVGNEQCVSLKTVVMFCPNEKFLGVVAFTLNGYLLYLYKGIGQPILVYMGVERSAPPAQVRIDSHNIIIFKRYFSWNLLASVLTWRCEFFMFSLPRPPEVNDLEDKVIFEGRRM